jgi:hypothetical protein
METRLRRCAMHEASHATLATIHHLPLARVRRQGAFSGSCPASVAELAHAARHLNQRNRCGRHCKTGMNRAFVYLQQPESRARTTQRTCRSMTLSNELQVLSDC